MSTALRIVLTFIPELQKCYTLSELFIWKKKQIKCQGTVWSISIIGAWNTNCSESQTFYIFNQPIMEHTEDVEAWKKCTMWTVGLWKAIEIWPLG